MFNDEDKAVVASLLTRYVRAWNARDADQKLLAEVTARVANHAASFQKLLGAFSLYGFEVAGTKETWDQIREAIGKEAYSAAIKAGNAGQEEKSADQPQKKIEMQSTVSQKPTVREGVLAKLRADGKEGSKAKDIRDFLEVSYAMKLHEKTVGMTLYRLAQDGLVSREGRTWFLVPPVADTKNPGAVTPGSEEGSQK